MKILRKITDLESENVFLEKKIKTFQKRIKKNKIELEKLLK